MNTRSPSYGDFIQAVRAYPTSHFIETLAAIAAATNGWDTELKPRMRPPWAVAAMVRESIVTGNEHRHGILDLRSLNRLFNRFNHAHDKYGHDIQTLLTPILYEQTAYQDSPYLGLTRSIALYDDQIPGCRPWPWEDVFGVPLPEVVASVFIIQAITQTSGGRYVESQEELEAILSAVGFGIDYRSVADRLTRTISDMKSAATSVPSESPAHRRFDYNPLIRTPLVRTTNGVFAPVPELIVSAVSASTLYHFGRDCWGNAFTQDLGSRVQAYVGRQFSLGLDAFEVHPEVEYAKGQRTADWFLSHPDATIIVECKASRASIAARYGGAALDQQVQRDIARAKKQIDDTARLLRSGHPTLAHVHRTDRPIYGLILTAEPFYLLGVDHTQELKTGIPTMLGALRDIETLMSRPSIDVIPALVRVATDPEKVGWPLGNALMDDASPGTNKLLDDVWKRIPMIGLIPDDTSESTWGSMKSLASPSRDGASHG